MGSRTKTVSQSTFTPLYEQDGDDIELMVEAMNSGVEPNIVKGEFDDRLFSILGYFSSRNANKVHLSTSSATVFDVTSAMNDSQHPSGYSNVNVSDAGNSDADIVMADYTSQYTSSVTIVSMTHSTAPDGSDVIDYTLSNGQSGTVAVTHEPIKKISYEYGGTTYELYAFLDNYQIDSDGELEFFCEPIKLGGEEVARRQMMMTLAKFGTRKSSFSEALENDKLKDLCYTYCADNDNELVIELYELLDGQTIRFKINGESEVKIYPAGGQLLMTFNNKIVRKDGKDVIMIPISMLDNLPIKDQYIQLKKTLGILTFASETIKLKWYQTTLFQIVFFVASLIYGYFTGDWSWSVSIVAGYAIKEVLGDSTIGKIATIALMLYSGDFSSISIQSVTNTLIVVSYIATEYTQYRIDNIHDDINELSEKEKEMKKAVHERRMAYSYYPVDEMPSLSHEIYNSYTRVYNATYDIYNK